MCLNLLQFEYFLLFGLLTVSIEHTFLGETGSDVSLVIEFSNYPWSCKQIYIRFLPVTVTSIRRYYSVNVMTSSDNGVQCLSITGPRYKDRIFNVSINFPTNVIFNLRNVSLIDSGQYYATVDEDYYEGYYEFRNQIQYLGEGILLVGDTHLQACILKQIELDFVLPLYALNESTEFVFYTGKSLPADIISTCDPAAGVCSPPRWTFSRLECRIKGSFISVTLKSVKMTDQGMYALIGSMSRMIHQSVILNVTECVSNVLATDIELHNTKIPKLMEGDDASGNTRMLYPQAIITSTVPITDQSFVIRKEYFIGGSAMAGIVTVTITLWCIWKRCRGRRAKSECGDDYDTVDVHYYSTIRNQHQCVTKRLFANAIVQEPQHLSSMMVATKMHDDI